MPKELWEKPMTLKTTHQQPSRCIVCGGVAPTSPLPQASHPSLQSYVESLRLLLLLSPQKSQLLLRFFESVSEAGTQRMQSRDGWEEALCPFRALRDKHFSGLEILLYIAVHTSLLRQVESCPRSHDSPANGHLFNMKAGQPPVLKNRSHWRTRMWVCLVLNSP